MDNKRIFLFGALALILFMIWTEWQKEHMPPPAPAGTAAPAVTTPAPTASDVPVAPTVAGVASETPRAPAVAAPRGARVEVTTDLVQAIIDTNGGDLRELRLRQHPVSLDAPETGFRLLADEGSIFIAQSGLIPRGVAGAPDHNSVYQAAQTRYTLAEGADELRVPLQFQGKDGLGYTKTYIFRRGSYAVDVEFAVNNRSKQEWGGYLYSQFRRSYVEPPGIFGGVPSYTGAAVYTPEKKYEKISFDDIASLKQNAGAKPGNLVFVGKERVSGTWVAMLQHYFVGAWMPAKSEQVQLYGNITDSGLYVAGYVTLAPATVAPGQTGVLRTRLYAGPKEQHRLHRLACAEADRAAAVCAEAEQTHAPGMDLAVDYGMLTLLSAPLFKLLEFIHKLIGNWGWSIVVLTLLVKLVFYPLSAMSYKSMAKMRAVAPKMEALKKQHGNDRQQLSQAMMELYKVEKINPLGGCLPILIQIPVFIALYWVLLESVEMRQAPWILWLDDLSSKDPYYVLPVIMGASMFLQQRLSPQPPDPVQRKVFLFMPLLFTGMFAFFPSGLVLYWTVNNLLSILQQWRINTIIEGGKRKGA